MEMTPRERVLCALGRGEPDRVPYCEANIDPMVATKLLGLEVPKELSVGSVYARSVEEEKALSRLLHRDNIAYKVIEPVFAETGKGKDGRVFFGKGRIRSEMDLELLKLPDPHDDGFYAEAKEYAKNKGEFALAFRTRMGIAPTYLSMGIEGFSYALYDNPRLVEKVLDIYCDFSAVLIEKICKLDFDFIWSADDLAWKGSPLFSPKFFREIMVPRIRRVAEKITIPWVHHSDGNILPVLDDLIDLGVNAIHPVEPAAMNINDVKKRYGSKICLIGNIDVNTLSMGTPEQVEEEVKTRIKEVAPGGGYIVSSGNSIAAYCNPDNVRAMTEAIQRYGKYPIHVD